MKKNNIVLFGIAVLCACSVPKERQPLTGGQWGEIKNGSAEEVVSSEVLYWQAPPARKENFPFTTDLPVKKFCTSMMQRLMTVPGVYVFQPTVWLMDTGITG